METYQPTGLAAEIFTDRYSLYPEEDYAGMADRVAKVMAGPESSFTKWHEHFYNVIASGDLVPGGRIQRGAGRPVQALLNCFTTKAIDSREGWAQMVGENIIIAGTGGGNGENYSPIRPRGTPIAGIGGFASGAVSIMRIENAALKEIRTGAARRAARMGTLNYNHPDIIEFVDAKNTDGEFENFNISVWFQDDPQAFFELVKADGDLELLWQNKPVKTIKARDLWNRILENSLGHGEPGMLNGYLSNKMNNILYTGREIISTNPCVTADTWVMTTDGPQQVKDLIGQPFNAFVNGQAYAARDFGFVQTGTHQRILRIETNRGYSLRGTDNHLVRMQAIGGTEVWRRIDELNEGDRLILNNHQDLEWQGSGTYEEGWLLGSLFGDGNLEASGCANLDYWGESRGHMTEVALSAIEATTGPRFLSGTGHNSVRYQRTRISSQPVGRVAASYGLMHGQKNLTEAIEKTSSAFHRGFLRGWFDADGSVQGTQVKGVSVRLTSVNEAALTVSQRMLLRLGIASSIYHRKDAGVKLLPNGRGSLSEYPIQELFEVVIAKASLPVFAERIGFHEPAKQARLTDLLAQYKRAINYEPFTATVTSVTHDGYEDVYDCTVPEIESFDANGIIVHNCGEIPLHAYSNCCLAAVALPALIKPGDTLDRRIDWERLHWAVSVGVRFLDNVLTVNDYPFEALKVEAEQTRRIGLGTMGLHYFLLELGLKYSSPEARALCEKVATFIKHTSYQTSVALAQEKGMFPVCDPAQIAKSGFVSTLKPSLRSAIRQHGLRNCALNTIAPTGTTGMERDVSPSLEPIFAEAWLRRYYKNDELVEVIVIDRMFRKFVDEGRDFSIFESASDIHPEDHLAMQQVWQKHTDNAVSKTINIPQALYTKETLSELYMKYLPHLKGLTIYPEGSREDTPLVRISREDALQAIAEQRAESGMREIPCLSGQCFIN